MGKDIFIDTLSELGVNSVLEKGKKLYNEIELRKKIKEYVEQIYKVKFEHLSLEDEIDFGGLCNYINNEFMADINGYLINTEKEKRDRAYQTIISKALYHAKAIDKGIVVTLINNLLDVILTFKSKNFKEEDILLGTIFTTDIIENFNSGIQRVEEKIDKLSSVQQNVKQQEDNSYWINQNTGEKLDPDKLYQNGIITAQFGTDRVRAEYTLPDGNKTYAEFDNKNNAVVNFRLAYPISEYQWDIPEYLILNEQGGFITHNGKNYATVTINLKWGKKVIKVFDNGIIVDFGIFTKSIIDDSNKIIHILDYTNEISKL